MIENRLVVTATSVPTDAPVGAVVSSIAGVTSDQRIGDLMRLASGTTQWKETRALSEIATCQIGQTVALDLDTGNGPRTSSLRCDTNQPPVEKRPEAISELTPGLWYVDLTRAQGAQVKTLLPKLETASGVVFDVRGYPTDAGAQILPHLMNTPETDHWMHVARIVGPFGRVEGWQSASWNLTPARPHVAGRIVFMTDGRAISYAESVMGYVADHKLGTIVGAPTAGTNGNVATFGVPGGLTIAFTGMRVTGHDGQTPYHLTGVKPDIAVAPTLAALRAGRDLVLERAVALIRDGK
jgi:hypothetical protein